MRTYSIYSRNTGNFTGAVITCADMHLPINVPDGYSCILGIYDHLAQCVDIETGAVIEYQPPRPSEQHEWDTSTKRWVYVPTLDDQKALKLAEINARCTALLNQIKKGYPDDEVQSWPKQEAEARAYAADGTTAVPLLSALSAARGIAIPDLVSRVIAKADLFAAASGQIIGIRQRCEDDIDAASTAEDVQAITWASQ